MKFFVAAGLFAGLAFSAAADEAVEVKPERRALLVEIIEGLGCKVNGAAPPPAFLDAMEKHSFVKQETKAIAAQLFEEGIAERSGPNLILKTEKCS